MVRTTLSTLQREFVQFWEFVQFCEFKQSRSVHLLFRVSIIYSCTAFFYRGDCGVRIQMLVLLLELFGSLSQRNDGDSELSDFLHDFLFTLISEVCNCMLIA